MHIISPFKDGSIHFLKIKLLSVENARDSNEICTYKHETGTVFGK